MKKGDYATSNKNPAGRENNDPRGKNMYYPAGSYIHEYGDREQVGSIQDAGAGGDIWKNPDGTLPYASWLDRWTDDPHEAKTLSYWTAVLILWKASKWQKNDGGLSDARQFSSIKEAEEAVANGSWLPTGPDGKPSATPPPKDCKQ
ncbi:hypothetical protein [Akkermansia glycaniphila]|uniref:hypothetical protein n=1 Tax=Akkermansia glycaniphila TaxID=1679444 RepID=UPI00159EF1B2|nr:hypothetical protein [Akkermansia glycaniphila]